MGGTSNNNEHGGNNGQERELVDGETLPTVKLPTDEARQKQARLVMIASDISRDEHVNEPGKRRKCKICKKNRDLLVYFKNGEMRLHMKLNKPQLGDKVETYCPYADPLEVYNATNAKFKKAKKLGVTILNEDEYKKLIG